MLKKLSELPCKIDNSSTVTVNLGDGGILKMSPTEILCLADEVIRRQQEQIKLICAESIYFSALKALDIPETTVAKIKNRLHDNTETIEQQTQEDEPDAKQDDVAKEHQMLYKFVTAFVNYDSLENEFEAEEFSVFGYKTSDLPDILRKYSFETEIDGEIIRIRLTGEPKTNEQQRTNRNPI